MPNGIKKNLYPRANASADFARHTDTYRKEANK